MRKGEAAALQWSDIDLKQMTISINKTLDFSAKDRSELFGDTKTYHSVRTAHTFFTTHSRSFAFRNRSRYEIHSRASRTRQPSNHIRRIRPHI